jgi:phosphopantothenoylcysteine decarboxylase
MTQPTAFDSSLHLHDSKAHLLLAASGSVATIKIPSIIEALSSYSSKLSIRLILTSSAANFLAGQSSEQPSLDAISRMLGVDGIYLDEDEWAIPWTRGAKILHIELRRWADLLVIAPLSANTLAKMAAGFCDNLLMSTVRAWDASGILDPPRDDLPISDKKKILVAPAMNTMMWFHPLTQKQLDILQEWDWVEILRPIEKTLACGDVGSGAMKDWKDIVLRIKELLGLEQKEVIET